MFFSWNYNSIQNRNNSFEVSIETLHTFADDIQKYININKIDLEDASERDWGHEDIDVLLGDEDSGEYLMLYFVENSEEGTIDIGETPEGLTYNFNGNAIIYEIRDKTSEGYIMMYPSDRDHVLAVLYTVSAFISIALFFILTLRLVKPLFSYITRMEEGVKIIASKDLTHKIEVVGDSELTSLAREINAMGEQIYQNVEREKELDKRQRALITNISHDLRTPLTSILGYTDLIDHAEDRTEQIGEYSKIVRRNALRLERLVNDLFLYTKLTSNDVKFDYSEIDLSLVIRQILELRTASYDFEIKTDNTMSYLDPEKFHRIIENICSNAEKYGLQDEDIEIELVEEEEHLAINIKNKTSDDIKHKISLLFDRMYVANEERTDSSSGLGLSIVKELTEKMGGSVELEFIDNTFIVKLKFNLLKTTQ